MKGKRVLYVSSEVSPYLPENEISQASYDLPKMVNDIGGQIRIFMPKYGDVNERRHQLHEVIRLSGMNLVVNDMDMQLVIKVASIPKERIQVYFIDNDEYFKRKGVLVDPENKLFSDNDERAIFFTKGVIETVKKLNWVPDIIHIQGWLASLLPIYLKKYYSNESIFSNTKIVTSIFCKDFEGPLTNDMYKKIAFDGFDENDINHLKEPTFHNIMKNAIDFSDGVIIASNDVCGELKEYIEQSGKPYLPYINKEEQKEAYLDFYTNKMQ